MYSHGQNYEMVWVETWCESKRLRILKQKRSGMGLAANLGPYLAPVPLCQCLVSEPRVAAICFELRPNR